MMDTNAIESRTSLLVALPPEIQRLIIENLNQYDLNRLCLTCKTIKAIVLPQLYETVVIKAPQKWSRLPSLEGLLGSTGDGLKYTTHLYIETQQEPLRESQQGAEDFRDPEQVQSETNLQFYLPQTSASNALNALIRILIFKLSEAQLTVFCWYHCCEVDAATVNILFERQKASLLIFNCNRYSSSCDLSGSALGGLCDLSIMSMDLDRGGCIWAASMLVKNAESLNELHLGSTARIAHEYALKRRPPYDEMSTELKNNVEEALAKFGPDPLIHLSLESLTLCGFDFDRVVLGELGLDIDFNNLTLLKLESCDGLSQAFDLLVDQKESSKLALSALQDLFVRLETADQTFSASLESFLTSIPGLCHLQVLIEKASAAQNLKPILEVHGKSLLTLVWDERRGPRRKFYTSTSLLYTKLGNLRVISRYCPGLTVLAIPLYWEAISSSDEYHVTIWRYLRRMPHLAAFNIRNLPSISGTVAMPMEYFVKGLAAMFVDVANKKGRLDSLRTIALSAPLYRDHHIGTHHVVHTALSDYLRFRVYIIDYTYPSPISTSPVLREIVRGAAQTSEEQTCAAELLDNYWLG